MPGKIPLPSPNLGISGLPVIHQQHGHVVPSPIQDQGSISRTWIMHPQIHNARLFIQRLISSYLKEKLGSTDWEGKHVDKVIRHLDDRLFEKARSMEDYMDLSTLALRLDYLVRHKGQSNRSELLTRRSSSSSTGSVMFNPSMPPYVEVHPVAPSSSCNTTVSSTDCDIVPPNSSGSLLPGSKGLSDPFLCQRFSASDGFIECHQRVNRNSFASAGNDMLLANSLLGQNISQLMPKISTSHSEDMISSDGSSVLSEKEQPNQHFGCQNGRLLHNGSGQERSGLSQLPSCNGFPNETHNGGLAFTGSTVQMTERMAVPQGYLNPYPYCNFLKPSQIDFEKTFDQRSDMHLMTHRNLSETGSLCISTAGVSEDYQDVSPLSIQSNFTSNPSWESSHLNFQTSEQAPLPHMQLDPHQHQQNLLYEKHSIENVMSNVAKSDGILHGIPCIKNENFTSDQVSLELKAQVHSQQINEQDKSCLPQHFVGGSTRDCSFSSENVAVAQDCNWSASGSGNTRNKLQDNEVSDQQKLLLLYYHARGCSDQGECLNNCCMTMKKMLNHMACCKDACSICFRIRKLLDHHRNCWDSSCFMCVPFRNSLYKNLPINFGEEKMRNSPCRTFDGGDADTTMLDSSSLTFDKMNLHPFSKRLKLEHTSLSHLSKNEASQASLSVKEYALPSPGKQVSNQVGSSTIRFTQESKPCESSSQGSSATVSGIETEDSEIAKEVKPVTARSMEEMKPCENSSQESSATVCQIKTEYSEVDNEVKHGCWPIIPQEIVSKGGREINKVSSKDKAELKEKCNISALLVDQAAGIKLGKPKIEGVSLVESFSLEQVYEHMESLRKWVGLSKAKVEKKKAMEYMADKGSCQLCGMGDISFEPPPMYCAKCYGRIKHNRTYYTISSNNMAGGDAGRSYFCNQCYNGSRGDNITYIGGVVSKKKLEKKRNELQVLELWVQCDKCEAWQHQICALFNGKKNEGGRAEFTCPKCYLKEIQCGERKPLLQYMILGANDLPKSKLSEHIEQRLFMRLKQEKQERANSLGKDFDDVEGAEDLIVRVVSSVDKRLEVKPLFREIFKEENYPAEFPYKSKAILLFQKIEGADVCLFGMYVQEFGSECPYPNQRRVCLSYIDSVKYFRPEIKAVTGESLRTFVYHEILIGYLDYCKIRGFTSCYIWSCPPLKQEDFILNCHPEIQKTPKPDKLREWYLAMLRKAAKENVVVDHTKLYDYFFMSTGECKAKVTAARLPYFDGDYWPGCAEDLLKSFQQQEDGSEPQKRGKMAISKRALKAVRHGALTDNHSKDNLLMFKIGDAIRPMRDDLIMVHLQFACSHCCELIVSGKRWVCNLCKNFQLCDKCHNAEQTLDKKDRHPINSRDKHSFLRVEVNDVPADTNDNDDNIQSEFFDSRLAFLSLCQGNHYQYDTLRRAKHSTMMILYHLHNPTAPAFVSSCSDCHNDIETGQGWHCGTCPEFDVCDCCYQREGAILHVHELVRQTSLGVCDVLQNKGTRQRQAPQIQDLLELLVHASKCRVTGCMYPFCHNVKGLFHHGVKCKIRQSGGCLSCKKMWYILQLHARACKEGMECDVPRCRDLKDHIKKMESQSDFRRRAGVMERMRQLEASVVSGDSE